MSEENVATVAIEAPKRSKKLAKGIEGNVISITVAGYDTLTFDVSTLPDEIQEKLIPFGAGHKLGDAAAGKEGQEAVDAISKVWEGLTNGDWTTRAPAAAKVSMSDIKANLANLSEAERAQAQALLASLGMKF
jgi:hypothetical protein